MPFFRKTFSYIIYLSFFCAWIHADTNYAYRIEFHGIDEDLGNLLAKASQLVLLQDRPPATAAALQTRINDDIPNLLKALQSCAYYNATIDVEVDYDQQPFVIHLDIDPGPLFFFAGFAIIPSKETSTITFPYDLVYGETFGIEIGMPADPAVINKAEDLLMDRLERSGYPLAKMADKEVIADLSCSTISVIFTLESGPLASFGETIVCGSKKVQNSFFRKKITWHWGDPYDPCAIQRTIAALELSGLFSSINVTHAEALDEEGMLPMQITVKEAKPRSIAFGVGYATDLGAGVIGEWEHLNMRCKGEKLSFTATIWQIQQELMARYVIPDYICQRQDLIWTVTAEHEAIKAYHEMSLSISGVLERQLTDRLRFSYGGMFTLLRNTHTDDNGQFNLFKMPLNLFWNGTNSLLEPTEGMTVLFKTFPTLQTLGHPFSYVPSQLTITAYQSLDCRCRFVLAAKATLGSMWGANRYTIPPSERFYAGSDTLLRGYHYMTVSPLGPDHKPIGGRSLMVYSMELRMKVYDPFGLVLFYDAGNVYSASLPQFGRKVLQSAGVGVRYHTPVGPLRLDVAIPFNPRKHLDRGYQVYFSIGQSF